MTDSQIIIVDDNAGVLFLHELMVRESGMPGNIETFDGAEKGLSFLRNRLESGQELLVFLDINMPAMSGWDFLEKLEELEYTENVHVVMVTSSVNRSDREKSGRYRHVVDYIEKPLSIETCKKVMNHDELKRMFTNGVD